MDTTGIILFFSMLFVFLLMITLPIIGSIVIIRTIITTAQKSYRRIVK